MTTIPKFEKELAELINKHSLEYTLEMPDFLIANLLMGILDSMYIAHHGNNSFHGMKAYPDDYKELRHKELAPYVEMLAASRSNELDSFIARYIERKKKRNVEEVTEWPPNFNRRVYSIINEQLTELYFYVPDNCSHEDEKTLRMNANEILIHRESEKGLENIMQVYSVQRKEYTSNFKVRSLLI